MKMKSVFLIIFLFSFLVSLSAQRGSEWGRMGARIEQLEKIKIIETLNLDEETSIKFFARRNKHRLEQKKILAKRDSLYKELTDVINSDNENQLKEKMDEIFNVEKEMLTNRVDFLNSLNDLLSEKQIAELVLFEFNFRNEIRHQFMKQHKKKTQN